MTACLSHILALSLGFTGDRFAVGDLWATHIGFYFKLTEQAIYDYFQMQLAHTTDDRLSSLWISAQLERRVFLC